VRKLFWLLAAVLLLPATAHASTVVPVRADTYVRSDFPNTNFEATSPDPLHVDGSPVRRTLLYFPNTPTDLTSAKLRVHVRFHTGEPFEVHLSSCLWSETGVTYSTAPAPGPLLATFADDPIGYVEVPIPVSALNTQYGGPDQSPTSNCFQLTKTGDNWMTLSSRESANPAQLVVETSASLDADGDGVPDSSDNCPGTPAGTQVDASGCPVVTSPVQKCSGTPVNVTPSTWRSVLSSRDNVVMNASPGTYSDLGMNVGVKTCVEIHCTASANIGESPNPNGCKVSGESTIANIRDLTIEGFIFTTSEDYGLAIYDESPYVGMRVRVAKNVFSGNMYHDISTKERVFYTEVVDNIFISCMRHCWEIGQNGNIPSRPSTTGTAVFRGNIVSSRINALTQRYNLTLRVENNDFRSVAGYVVNSWPFWTLYLGEYNLVPGTYSNADAKVPLRTSLVGNKFSSGNRLRFTGRGVIDDVVLVKGNTGVVPSCVRGGMDSQDSGTSAAHSNEETTAPPKLDPTSDVPC